jgi:hypothetical protein
MAVSKGFVHGAGEDTADHSYDGLANVAAFLVYQFLRVAAFPYKKEPCSANRRGVLLSQCRILIAAKR